MEIQNIVACANLGCKFQLKTLATKIAPIKYNPQKFHPIVLAINGQKVLIFASGRIVINGGKTEEQCKSTAEQVVALVSEHGYTASLEEFKIANIVASAHFDQQLRLYTMTVEYNAPWEREFFPGAYFRFKDPKATVVAFCSGAYYVTGIKRFEDIEIINAQFQQMAQGHLFG